jgi:hypothetical protein
MQTTGTQCNTDYHCFAHSPRESVLALFYAGRVGKYIIGRILRRWLADHMFVSFVLFVSRLELSRPSLDHAIVLSAPLEQVISSQYIVKAAKKHFNMSFGAPGGGSVNYKPSP